MSNPGKLTLQQAFDSGFEAVKRYIDEGFALHEKRIAALERQTSEFKYLGIWDATRTYRPGNFCTHDGSVWHCNTETRARPGDGADWVLAVKRGRDGRDTGK